MTLQGMLWRVFQVLPAKGKWVMVEVVGTEMAVKLAKEECSVMFVLESILRLILLHTGADTVGVVIHEIQEEVLIELNVTDADPITQGLIYQHIKGAIVWMRMSKMLK